MNAAIFILLEIAALKMLSNNGPLQNIWISQGMHIISAKLWGSTQDIKDYFSLRKTNDSLAVENHNLRLRVADLESLVKNDESLKQLLQDDAAQGFQYIPASIVKISNNSQHNYIIVDKGSEQGVSSGSGIISGNGAIGVIDAVGKNYSYARSFKNSEMNISARLGKDGSVGPMSWDGFSSNKAILKEIPHHVELSPGDTVYTSGFSSIFPPDIPLGTTGEFRIVNGATYEIQVQLFADFTSLRYVSIVNNLSREEIKELEDRL